VAAAAIARAAELWSVCRLCVGKGGADAAALQVAALSAGGLSLRCWRAAPATRSDVCAAGARGARGGALGGAHARTAWAPRCGTAELARTCELERLRVHGGRLWPASMQGGCGRLWREEWGLHGSAMQLPVGSAFVSFSYVSHKCQRVSEYYQPALINWRVQPPRAWPRAKCTRGASGNCQLHVI